MATNRQGSKPLAFVLVGIVVGSAAYVASSEPQLRYSLGVEQAWERAEQQLGRNVRIQGVLVPGTLQRRADGCGLDAALAQHTGAARRVFVHYDGCAVPDTLCDLAPSRPPSLDDFVASITVDGTLERRGDQLHLQASQFITKCPGKYWYPLEGGPAELCKRHRAGFYCPICEGTSGIPPHARR